ncbi:DUF2254 domain-containing protein [Sphingomonas sp. LY160]|uniref:DUF2254 domain-containing protein n=1 Tax=Sphingomonas sp. LY160 TaxID=3095342 RepID=UPI002ADEB419|nr:DUF2254 domain-containing protein [Sphingomonas sp. LY160]MEA1072822.1 DUF2254 domain-containing protein [Sphingomonas sp. LY160]
MLRRIWVRATIYSLAAVLVALLAAVAGPYIPYDPQLTLASGAVGNILNILAASMLAVTTFSLSIMVSAYSAATSNATPRSIKLLLADPIAQSTLSTFVGTFLFSIVGIIGIVAGIHQGKGRVFLFLATLIVLVIVVAALMRWIEQIGSFGRISDIIERVEKAARRALIDAGSRPNGGALPPIDIPGDAQELRTEEQGRLLHVDLEEIEERASKGDYVVHMLVSVGSLIHPARPVMAIAPAVDDEELQCLRECLSISSDREFDGDPRYGLIVLSEIASRALSPAVNDPGTAIEVVDAALRLLVDYSKARREPETPICGRVHAPALDMGELLFDFVNPLARDGAAMLEVQERLLTILEAIAAFDPGLYRTLAIAQVGNILDRSSNLSAKADRDRLEKRAASIMSALA